MSFGDGIDWAVEARRAALADSQAGTADLPIGRSELVDRLVELLPERGLVLDAGCNIGRYCPLLLSAGFHYVGVDQSPEALEIARARNPNGQFVQSFLWEMEAIPCEAAISMAVLQHNVHEEKERILPRIAACVRPGGIFAMSESTVPVATKTQLTHDEWIALVVRHGFELVSTWHPNPEYGLNDSYVFRRTRSSGKTKAR